MLQRLSAFLSEQIGLDPARLLRALLRSPGYLVDLAGFRRGYSGRLRLRPCLHDRTGEAGNLRGEYFIQDLLVARKIHERNPQLHVDVGSRIDGFVAHVASFRTLEVWDIRPVTREIPGVVFRRTDVTRADGLPTAHCDSLSCLHALEHFGLGRYGDPLDPDGSRKGLRNLAAALTPGGRLHLSVPIGQEIVLFNSHRIFDPHTIVQWAQSEGLELQAFTSIHLDDTTVDHPDWHQAFAHIRMQPYCLGLFEFVNSAAERTYEGAPP
jgi:hypothetical protein